MNPEQKSTNRRDRTTVAIIVVVLAVVMFGLMADVAMQAWSYLHEPPQQTITK